jgi:hypothetical protein
MLNQHGIDLAWNGSDAYFDRTGFLAVGPWLDPTPLPMRRKRSYGHGWLRIPDVGPLELPRCSIAGMKLANPELVSHARRMR